MTSYERVPTNQRVTHPCRVHQATSGKPTGNRRPVQRAQTPTSRSPLDKHTSFNTEWPLFGDSHGDAEVVGAPTLPPCVGRCPLTEDLFDGAEC